MTRVRGILLLAWAIVLSVGGILIWSAQQDREWLEGEARARALTLVRMVGAHAESVMDATQLALSDTHTHRLPSTLSADDPAAIATLHAALQAAVEHTPAVDHLLFADASGQVLTSSMEHTLGGSMRDEPYFEALRADPRPRILTTTVRGRVSGRWGLILARPVTDAQGRLMGVLAAHIGLEKTFLAHYRQLGLSAGTAISVWNDQRTLLLRHPFDERLIGTRVDVPALNSLLVGLQDETSLQMRSPLDGIERMAAVRRLEHHPLIVSVSQSREEYLAPWYDTLWLRILPIAAMLAACALLTRSLLRQARAEQRLQTLLDAAPLGVVCFDLDNAGKPVAFAANAAARNCLGPTADGKDVVNLAGLDLSAHLLAARDWQSQDVRLAGAAGERRLDLRMFSLGAGQAGLLIEDASERHEHLQRLTADCARWSFALEEASNGVRDWNLASGSVLYSKAWKSLLGFTEGEIGDTLEEWESRVHPQDLTRCRHELERHLEGFSAAYRSEHRMRCKDGSYRWVLERGRVTERHEDGRPLRMIVSQVDIAPLRQLEDNLALWSQVFARAIEGIIITDANARIIEANDAYCANTGYERSRLIGQNPSLLSSGRQNADFYREMWASLRETGLWQGELLNRRANGSLYSQRTTISAIYDREGKPCYFIGFTTDVSELRESQEKLEKLALHDALTLLPNRLQLAEHMRQAIAMAQRSNRLLAVCALDIDHFKPINERWGSIEGDRLLIEVATRLQQSLLPGDSLARLGGDEFILLLAGLESSKACETRMQELLLRLRAPFERDTGVVRLTASIGVTLYPLDSGDPDTLLRHADQALYGAKQQGRDRCQIFDAEEDRRLRINRRAVSDIRGALDRGELRLHYQPKVRFDDGSVVGVEALLRWQHPERGLLRAADFMSQINDDALLVAIGEWGLRTAIAQAVAWHGEGQAIPVSLNVTAGQILRKGFAETLIGMLDEQPDFPAHLLEIEILESAALEDLPRVVELMQRCSARGVSFALDDFGTGYASLTYLKHLPAATLKIDQSFVRDILDDPEHRAIVEGVLSLTRVFGRTAIAEGVESIEHGVALVALGATHAQGYAIAGALPAEDLPEWVDSWRNPPEWTRAAWRYRNTPVGASRANSSPGGI